MAKYDLAIIGSGPGGYNTAIRAAQWGLKTVGHRKRRLSGRHLPARRLHSHQSAAAHRRNLRHVQKCQGIRHRREGIHAELAGGAGAQGKSRQQARQGHRISVSQEQGRDNAGLGPLGGAGTRERRKRRQDHRSRSHAHHVRHRLGGALAARRRDRRQDRAQQHRNSAAARRAENAGDRRSRRGGRRIRVDLQFVWDEGHRARNAAARDARRGRRNFRGTRKSAEEKGHSDFHRSQSGIGEERRQRRHRFLQGQGRENRRRSPPSAC